MSKSKINLLFFFSAFPIWILKANFQTTDLLFIIFLFFVVFLINQIILFFLKKDINNFFFQVYLSLLISFALDVNLGLQHGLVFAFRDNFEFVQFLNIYYISLITLVFAILIIFLIIKNLKINGLKILSSFIFVIFVFNILDNTKNSKNIVNFDKTNLLNKNFDYKKLIIITDEMSGVGSLESKTELGKQFDVAVKQFSKEYNFNLYTNIFSTHYSSISSLSSILSKNYKISLSSNFHKKSKNYFNEFDFTRNDTFNKFKSISVLQSMHINFCKNKRVLKCHQYNQFIDNDFTAGFRNTFLGRFISAYKLYGSINAFILTRILQEIDLVDLTMSPFGDKAFFEGQLQKVKKDIASKKFDLIFLHAMTPHRPYGFDKACRYDGKKSIGNYSLISTKESVYRHNTDRICTINFLKKLIEELDEENLLEKLEIIIFSDHGSRIIMNNPESALRSILMFRDDRTSYEEINKKKNTPEVFKKIIFD